jgi:hypothetical protein
VDAEPESGDLIRLLAATEIALALAERVDGDVADEAIIAELHELHDRARRALRSLTEKG